MRALDRCRDVTALAEALGVPAAGGASVAVVRFCRQRLDAWVGEASHTRSIDDVERAVCDQLGLTIEEAWTDAELLEISRRYLAGGEPVFACLAAQFDSATYAVLIRRRQPDQGGREQHVAVIDCRGAKKHRRFFSRWHEIAHMMTLPPTVDAPVHRSRGDRSGLERLMDAIAAELGFYEPLFAPMVAAEVKSAGGLTFSGVERVRRAFSLSASFEATLGACVERLAAAAGLIEAGLGFNAEEERQFATERLPSRRPKPRLRVLKTVGNEAARAVGFVVRPHCRVPEQSALQRVFFDREGLAGAREIELIEDCDLWRSAGLSWPGVQMRMVAIDRRDRLMVLLFPQENVKRLSKAGFG